MFETARMSFSAMRVSCWCRMYRPPSCGTTLNSRHSHRHGRGKREARLRARCPGLSRASTCRHHRACPGDPRCWRHRSRTWMPGTSARSYASSPRPGMTSCEGSTPMTYALRYARWRAPPDGQIRSLACFLQSSALQKINRFSLGPNQIYNPRRLVPLRGVSRSSRTRDGMRWTPMVLLTNGT